MLWNIYSTLYILFISNEIQNITNTGALDKNNNLPIDRIHDQKIIKSNINNFKAINDIQEQFIHQKRSKCIE